MDGIIERGNSICEFLVPNSGEFSFCQPGFHNDANVVNEGRYSSNEMQIETIAKPIIYYF